MMKTGDDPGWELDRDGVVEVIAGHVLARIGDEIRRAREARGLKISDVARQSGISRNSLSAFESARGNPTIEMLVRYASALGMAVEIELR